VSKSDLTGQGVRNLNAIGKKPPKKACAHPFDDIYVIDVKENYDGGTVNILACNHCNKVLGDETDFEVVLPPLT
jgi:hypothetical protein